MSVQNMSVRDLIDVALNTTSLDEMMFLQVNPSMNVRRALARNKNIDPKVLQRLQHDPVENVSYIASLNSRLHSSREFSDLSACVLCDKDERSLNCINCEKIAHHSF